MSTNAIVQWVAVGVVIGCTICNLIAWYMVIRNNRTVRNAILSREPDVVIKPEFQAQETPPPLTVLHSNDSFERPPA